MKNILKCFRGERGELIPILQKMQERFGYIPPEKLPEVAKFIHISESRVYGVITFYSQFSLVPKGRYRIKVCLGTACHVRSGDKIVETIERNYDVKQGQTTENGKFSLDRVACFGSCALAPVMVVNDQVYGRMTPTKALEILEKLP